MESDAYLMGYADYSELQCVVQRNRDGVYVWDSPIGETSASARVWADAYIEGWCCARSEAEAHTLKRVSTRPCAA